VRIEQLNSYCSELQRWGLAFPAVYFLILGNDIVYVGETKNLFARIGAHRMKNHIPFNDVFWMPAPVEAKERRRLESLFIRLCKPRYNRNRGAHLSQAALAKKYADLISSHFGANVFKVLDEMECWSNQMCDAIGIRTMPTRPTPTASPG
jgi:hypothetical protein